MHIYAAPLASTVTTPVVQALAFLLTAHVAADLRDSPIA
jgi:hypothetical protein